MDRKRAIQPDRRLARLAASQHGVVSLDQLRMAGISPDAAIARTRTGRLHRVHRGVYAVGHEGLSDRGLRMAAVLAIGPRAVLSHRPAAALWGLLPPAGGAVDVTVPSAGGRRRRRGIRTHRSASLAAGDITRRDRIPVTTPARTLRDLRPQVAPQQLDRALRKASYLGHRVEDLPEPAPTRSELERRFLSLCRRRRIREPEVNVAVAGFVVDFLWRDAGLIVETDGYAAHRGRAAFEHDRRRQTALAAAGFEVLRFSWRGVVDHPDAVARAVRARLSASAAGGAAPGAAGGATRGSARPA